MTFEVYSKQPDEKIMNSYINYPYLTDKETL